MRRAPLYGKASEIPPSAIGQPFEQVVRHLGAFVRWFMTERQAEQPQSVPPEAMSLGRWIDGATNRARISQIFVHSAPGTGPKIITTYTLQALQDMESAGAQTPTSPLPSARLTLIGRGYAQGGASRDDFYCTFGVFPLPRNERAVALLAPERASVMMPAYAVDNTELFAGMSDRERMALRGVRHLNLGTLDVRGNFHPFRAVNMHAFGTDISAILGRISAADAPILSFDIKDDQIEW